MTLANDLSRTIKYPTSLIVRGGSVVGVELAKSLLEQGGYVVMIDYWNEYTKTLIEPLQNYDLFTFVDYGYIEEIEDYLRRMDYIFYLGYKVEDLEHKISTQEFLEFSKFIDSVLRLAIKFESKFLLATSMKAHEYLLSKSEMEINFNEEAGLHTVYSEAEIQRYGESLTLEYIAKSALDARIVRLAEIIGEGIEFNPDTTVGRLMKEAISTETLTIYGDGLDSEYYVHLQDAVYAVIKAQFSKNTRGETFSIAYEYEISALSIVYKINEFVETPREIVFSKEEDKKLMLRLYKPAPNIMRIGWKPRVNFERALKQTYEYLKKYLKSNQALKEDESIPKIEDVKTNESKTSKPGFLQNLKNRFSKKKPELLENKVEVDVPEDATGALGRLIAERKSQEKGRKEGVVVANQNLIKKYRDKKEKALTEQMSLGFVRRFDNFMKRFDTFKYITLKQFSVVIFSIILFIFFYLNVFAVILASGRDLVNLYLSVENLKENTDNYEQALADSRAIENDIKAIQERFDRFEVFGSVDFVGERLLKINRLSSNLYTLNNSFENSANSLSGLNEFINKSEFQIIYREDGDSILAVQPSGSRIDDLNKVNKNHGDLDASLKSYNNTLLNLKNETFFPQAQQVYSQMIGSYESLSDDFVLLSNANNYITPVITDNTPHDFVMVLVDNTTPAPIGGRPLGYIKFTVSEGNISDVVVSKDILNEHIASTNDKFLLQKISLSKYQIVAQDEVKFSDLSYLQDGQMYLDEIARSIGAKYNSRIDGVMVVNLNFLNNMLGISEEIKYQDVTFRSDNFLATLNLFADSNGSTESRDKAAMNVFAISWKVIMNNFGVKFPQVAQIVSEGVNNKDLVIKFYNLPIQNKSDHFDNSVNKSSDYVKALLVGNNSQIANTDVKIDLNIDVVIKDDLTTRKTVSVDATSVNNLDYVSLCMPGAVFNVQIPDDGTVNAPIQNFDQFESCIKLLPKDSNRKFIVSFDSVSFKDTLSNKYDYELAIRKQPGVKTNLSMKFLPENITIDSYSQGGVIDSTNLNYPAHQMTSDEKVSLNVS